MTSEYERHGTHTAPGNGKPKRIVSGHTPDFMTRMIHARTVAMTAVDKARANLAWIEATIAELEQYGQS